MATLCQREPWLSICLEIVNASGINQQPEGAYVTILTSPATKANKTPHEKGVGSMRQKHSEAVHLLLRLNAPRNYPARGREMWLLQFFHVGATLLNFTRLATAAGLTPNRHPRVYGDIKAADSHQISGKGPRHPKERR